MPFTFPDFNGNNFKFTTERVTIVLMAGMKFNNTSGEWKVVLRILGFTASLILAFTTAFSRGDSIIYYVNQHINFSPKSL